MMGAAVTQKRRRFKQQFSLQDGLSAWAKGVKEQAEHPARAGTGSHAQEGRQADTAFHIEDWAHSPALQPQKTLGGLARDLASLDGRPDVAVEVRTEKGGHVFQAALIFDANKTRQ